MRTLAEPATGSLGLVGYWVVERKWARFALALATLGYVGLLIVLAPSGEPVGLVLMAVPALVAGAWFGLRTAFLVTGALLLVTAFVVETIGIGIGETITSGAADAIPLVVVTAALVGRLHDVSVALAKEVQRSRLAEHDLRMAEARLTSLLDANDDLITTVGRELRTPLTSVLGFAELLRVGSDIEIASKDRQEMVEFIANEAFDLSAIVDDLLVAARLEVDRLDVTTVPTSLRSQVSQALEAWDNSDRPRIAVSGDDVRALADPAGVRQILRNLIANAVRYGGSQIEVAVGTDAGQAIVEVSDNGTGLPMVEWERIFEPHYRYHADPTKKDSSGLGLTVSRGLATKMGGSLTYRYDGQKSRFRLSLPALKEPRDDSVDDHM